MMMNRGRRISYVDQMLNLSSFQYTSEAKLSAEELAKQRRREMAKDAPRPSFEEFTATSAIIKIRDPETGRVSLQYDYTDRFAQRTRDLFAMPRNPVLLDALYKTQNGAAEYDGDGTLLPRKWVIQTRGEFGDHDDLAQEAFRIFKYLEVQIDMSRTTIAKSSPAKENKNIEEWYSTFYEKHPGIIRTPPVTERPEEEQDVVEKVTDEIAEINLQANEAADVDAA